MKKLLLGVFLVVCWCGSEVYAQDMAVKTNLLYWATTTPNLGVEIGLGKQTTLDISGGYNPWTLDKAANKKIKHWLVVPDSAIGCVSVSTVISSDCMQGTGSTI